MIVCERCLDRHVTHATDAASARANTNANASEEELMQILEFLR